MTAGHATTVHPMTSLDRADRAPIVQRSRSRSAQQQDAIIAAARRLSVARGAGFTTQELIKEAGVALQTFYRHFEGKDQLLLAVIEDTIAEAAIALRAQAEDLPDPVARLRYYVRATVESVGQTDGDLGPQFVTSEHWRLHQLYPQEIARATQPVTDLMEEELRAAAEQGLLQPTNPSQDAWFTMKLVMSVFHHYAFVGSDEHLGNVADDLWSFCLAAFGGR